MPPTQLAQNQALAFYGMLQSVRTVTTTDIALTGVQNINGAIGAAGDRVLVANQTVTAQDGIYLMQAGAWERAGDAEALAPMISRLNLGAKGQLMGSLSRRYSYGTSMDL
jgi:hypothetical protein